MADKSIISDENDIGIIFEMVAHRGLHGHGYVAEEADKQLRKYWNLIEDYFKRQIICNIEVGLALMVDGYEKVPQQDLWKKFVGDMRPPKAAYTTQYHCDKCKVEGVKLWRGVHGCSDKDDNKLLCAACLAPGVIVNDKGKAYEKLCDMETDQVNGWLPAVPVDDTYWGYSSVPSADVEWWKAFPTYKK